MTYKLAYSPCPNDTFIFDAMVHGRVDTEGLNFEVVHSDILHLNQMAEGDEVDIVKASYFTFGRVFDRYRLLDSGGALGRGCGPLLISHQPIEIESLSKETYQTVVPGFSTTAFFLLSFFNKNLAEAAKEALFHEIMPQVASKRADLGVIIHENRFTYPDHGLVLVQDLGQYWEEKTGMPIPLGGILAHKKLGSKEIEKVGRVLRRSVEYALKHPDASNDYVKSYAQEMDPVVCQAHINLYVNDFSVSLGKEGWAAVGHFLLKGEEFGLLPKGTFWQFQAEYI